MNSARKLSMAQHVGRFLLGIALTFAGVSHLSWSRAEFLAQVPRWVPFDTDLIVVLSGLVEIALGLALLILAKQRPVVGWLVAAFFVLIFPGNIAQYANHTPAFGLLTDQARLIRLFFQPLLVIWALWSTGAWQAWRRQTPPEIDHVDLTKANQ